MFGVDFFPTPDHIIEKMLSPYLTDTVRGWKFLGEANKPVLEPSAGNGAICDKLAAYRVEKGKIHCCEIDLELRYVLQSKGYKVIGSDFLEQVDPILFGFIIMNPPFSDGDSHVLKAWELLKPNGDLVALVNSETINNPYSKERKLLVSLIEKHGSTEDLGQCFANAERRTDVNVTMIRLKKPAKDQPDWFQGQVFDKDAFTDEAQFSDNPLASRDAVKMLVARYNVAASALKERDLVQSKLNFYLNDISRTGCYSDRRGDAIHQEHTLDDQIAALKMRFWNTLFERTKMGERCPSGFKKKFEEMSTQQCRLAFTERNIWEILEIFFQNQEQILEDTMLAVFDKATAYHEKNQIHIEGWKTNKAYALNKRIIHPYVVRQDDYWVMRTYEGSNEFLDDIDRTLAWISGQSFEAINKTYRAIYQHCHTCRDEGHHYSDAFESTFFKIRIYKKGTAHLDFKDLELLDEFNYRVGKLRQWIGNGDDKRTRYGRKKASDSSGAKVGVEQLTLPAAQLALF